MTYVQCVNNKTLCTSRCTTVTNFSPRAKNFDCGGCELALLGLTMCPMRSEPPYDFPQGVPAAIFHQTVKFKAIFWARTNVVKMSFASRPVSRVNCARRARGDGVKIPPPDVAATGFLLSLGREGHRTA